MKVKTLTIKQGDSDTLTDPITGLTSLSGYSCKMYIVTIAGVEVDTITGSISGLICTYEIVNDNSKSYPVEEHYYECKLFDSLDHVYTPSGGIFVVEKAEENDPT